MDRHDWPSGSLRAKDWVEAFCKHYPNLDRGLMFGWFAEALATGFNRGLATGFGPWHPIETAPRNGMAVLVMRDDWPGTPSGRAEECVGHNTYVAEWWEGEGEGGKGCWVCYMDSVHEPRCPIEPTHWTYLPPPPAVFGADEEKIFTAEALLYDEAKTAVEAAGGVWPFEKL